MAKSTKALLTGRIQMCKTNPSVAHIGLATHGRSIQIGSSVTGRDLSVPLAPPSRRTLASVRGRHVAAWGLNVDEAGQSMVAMPLNLSRSELVHRPGDGTSLREGLVS